MPELLVGEIMTNEVKTVGRNDSVATADELMQLGRIRHIVVVDEDGSLVGVLSQRGLFLSGLSRALGYGTHVRTRALEDLVVKEAMVADVVTTTPDTPLSNAAVAMLSRKDRLLARCPRRQARQHCHGERLRSAIRTPGGIVHPTGSNRQRNASARSLREIAPDRRVPRGRRATTRQAPFREPSS
jgi:CBS domain-containing membrane protein